MFIPKDTAVLSWHAFCWLHAELNCYICVYCKCMFCILCFIFSCHIRYMRLRSHTVSSWRRKRPFCQRNALDMPPPTNFYSHPPTETSFWTQQTRHHPLTLYKPVLFHSPCSAVSEAAQTSINSKIMSVTWNDLLDHQSDQMIAEENVAEKCWVHN